jgi:tRNA-Thr(GGU) m(6)t(6)A37 methyltransferase TsaA
MRAEIVFIGRIETPYKTVEECPRNVDRQGPLCRLLVDPPYDEGLMGLEPGRSILVLYWLAGADRGRLRQSPPHVGGLKGTFALRSPHRPNPIGAAVVEVVEISGRAVTVRGLDCVDGTPLLDIKPAMRGEEMRGE